MSTNHQGGIKTGWFNDRVELEFNFIETELSFRDAFLQTIQDVRDRTDKDIVLCFSGGADSQLVKWGFDYLGIKTRSVHQRYMWNDCYINWQEARWLPDDTEFINIDVHEFQKSELFHERFVKEFPQSVHSAIQCDMRCDPETDYLISCSSTYSIYKFDFRDDKRWCFCPSNAWKTIGLREYDYTGILYDNGYITYALFDDLYKKMAREMERGKWEYHCKHDFYRHHFPELDEKFLPQKYNNNQFPYFHTLVLDRLNAMYQYEIDGEYYKHDCYPQRTFVGMEMEEFWDTIEHGATLNFKRDWVKYGEPLVTDDGGLQNIQ